VAKPTVPETEPKVQITGTQEPLEDFMDEEEIEYTEEEFDKEFGEATSNSLSLDSQVQLWKSLIGTDRSRVNFFPLTGAYRLRSSVLPLDAKMPVLNEFARKAVLRGKLQMTSRSISEIEKEFDPIDISNYFPEICDNKELRVRLPHASEIEEVSLRSIVASLTPLTFSFVIRRLKYP
jgi:hypothetical protein